ncbi:MAG: hypothetical protein H6723_19915, partial [Sandaracinus sp.]|nr:hypothetical protein [Sandaracinus sp.]
MRRRLLADGRSDSRPRTQWLGLISMLAFASLPATVHAQFELVPHSFVAEAGPRPPEPARCLDELLVALRPLAARGGRPHVELFEAVAGLERCGLDDTTRAAARAIAAQLRRRRSVDACGDELEALVAPFEPALRSHCPNGRCHPTHEALKDLRASSTGVTLLFR